MVSKLSKYVMVLLHKKPMNPYEIAKLSDRDVIRSWFPMIPASIYTTIKNLEKKDISAAKVYRKVIIPPRRNTR